MNCFSCMENLECDGNTRICSACNKDCCIYCSDNMEIGRLCSECVKDQTYRQKQSDAVSTHFLDICPICFKHYPQTMFYNCRVCTEKRCFNCISEYENTIEGICILCTTECSAYKCDDRVIVKDSKIICGQCNVSFALCTNHIKGMKKCRDSNCYKTFCLPCSGVTKQYLFCTDHKNKCTSCSRFINSKNWKECEKCNKKACHKCNIRKRFFPLQHKKVCADHIIACSICTKHIVEPGFTYYNFDGKLCRCCVDNVQAQLMTFCCVWNSYQRKKSDVYVSFPFVIELGLLLLKELANDAASGSLDPPAPSKVQAVRKQYKKNFFTDSWP